MAGMTGLSGRLPHSASVSLRTAHDLTKFDFCEVERTAAVQPSGAGSTRISLRKLRPCLPKPDGRDKPGQAGP
jgi:hypothetical protein